MIGWIILIAMAFILIGIRARVKKRGFFWSTKSGEGITLKDFFKRWKEGIEGATPLQQTRITLWAFLPLFAGIFWGIAITFISKTYWMCLILCGSCPITSVQFLSNWQKYKSQKAIQKVMDKLNKVKK